MKVKAGSGNPFLNDRLQTLQTQLNKLEESNIFFISNLRYDERVDWRLWSETLPVGVAEHIRQAAISVSEAYTRFKVSPQCRPGFTEAVWNEHVAGYVCICGHPEVSHNGGILCEAGIGICYCARYSKTLRVSDVRYFFKATKGPHESHALVLGLSDLLASGGSSTSQVVWQCSFAECGQMQRVNPCRMGKGRKFTLGATALERHKLVCEACLYRGLNGGFFSG